MHEMIGEIDGDEIIWTCPTCGRVVRVMRGGIPVTEFAGDAFTLHSGGMGRLQIGSITVGELARDELAIWREWADEIDLPSLLDNDDVS